MLSTEPRPTCTWDINPDNDTHDLDVDGLDLDAAIGDLDTAQEVETFAQQFGKNDC